MRSRATTILLFVSALVIVGAIYINNSHDHNQFAGQKMNIGRTGDIVAPEATSSSNQQLGSTETKTQIIE